MSWRSWLVLCAATAASAAHATNDELQALFFAACVNPSDTLAVRCGETDSAQGDLSGDSESSLNPSQSLSAGQASLRTAIGRADDARDRAREARAREARSEEVMEIGRLGVLGSAAYTWEERDRTVDVDEERGFEADYASVEGGLDYRVTNDLVVGALLTWDAYDLDVDAENPGVNFTPAADAGSIESDKYGVVAFALLTLGTGGYLDLSAGWQSGDNDYERRSVFQEAGRIVPQTNSVVTATGDSEELWIAANLGWQFALDAWTFSAAAGVTATDTVLDGFTERDRTGTGLAMAYTAGDQTSLVGTLSVQVQRAIGTEVGVFVPYLRVDFAHEFEDRPIDYATRYVLDGNRNTLNLSADEPDENYVTAALGVSTIFPNGWIPYLDVSYWAGYDDLSRTRVQIGLRREF